MTTYVVLSIVFIFAMAALGLFFGPDDFGNGSRAVFGVWLGWVAACLIGTIWVIYVVAHFLQKYW